MPRLSPILIALLMLGAQPHAGIAQWVSRPTFHTALDTLRPAAAPPSAAGADSASVRLRTEISRGDSITTRDKFMWVGWMGGFFGGLAICKAMHFERRNLLLAMAMVVPCGTLGGFAGAVIGVGVYHATH